MDGYIFDILNEWPRFLPYLETSSFIEALNIHHWWNFKEQNGSILPLMQKHDNMSTDEIYVIDKLKSLNSKSPYWYCCPHDCVELNPIIMGTLISLYTNKSKKELFYLSIVPNHTNSYDQHIVVCNKQLFRDDIIHLFRNKNTLSTACHNDVMINDKLILFDLIYPLMPFFGNSWEIRNEKLEILKVKYCDTLENYWKSMNYVSYYNS